MAGLASVHFGLASGLVEVESCGRVVGRSAVTLLATEVEWRLWVSWELGAVLFTDGALGVCMGALASGWLGQHSGNEL